MATATLTAGLLATHSYNSLPITANPVHIPAGETVFVSQGLATVEAFTTSAVVAPGAFAIPVVTQVSAHAHNIGENVAPKFSLTAVGRTMVPVETPRTRRL